MLLDRAPHNELLCVPSFTLANASMLASLCTCIMNVGFVSEDMKKFVGEVYYCSGS